MSEEWNIVVSQNIHENFNQFIDRIKELDHSTDTAHWVKWKNYAHQVVLKGNNYYFKIYQNYHSNDMYDRVRQALAKIYTQRYGLFWKIYTIQTPQTVYQVECRQPLKVMSRGDMPFEDVLLGWNRTLALLEKEIGLPLVAKQLRLNEKYADVAAVKLIRDCINKYEDYALTPDGDVVLLDDADWFLAFVGEDGSWLQKKFDLFPVATKYGERMVIPYEFDDVNKIPESMNKFVSMWNWSNCEYWRQKIDLDFYSVRQNQLMGNIRLLAGNKYIEDQNMKKYIEYNLQDRIGPEG